MKSYRQYCGVAKALDVVGERWTLLIVRDLLLGPRRYSDLMSGLSGITTNLLAKRLRQLQDSGLLEQHTLPAPAGANVYRLTELGRSLKPAVLALGAFGAQFMGKPSSSDRLSHRWAMVSLMRRVRASEHSLTIELRIDDTVYQGKLDAEGLRMCDGTPWTPDVSLHGPMSAHAQWIAGGRPIADLVREGLLEREGPAKPLQIFQRLLR